MAVASQALKTNNHKQMKIPQKLSETIKQGI